MMLRVDLILPSIDAEGGFDFEDWCGSQASKDGVFLCAAVDGKVYGVDKDELVSHVFS